MKLYLSSYGTGTAAHELGTLVGPNRRTAMILNALDVYGPRLAPQVSANREALARLDLDPVELDLRDFFGDSSVGEALAPFGAVWLAGGNSFVLRRALRASGFDDEPADRVRSGDLVYAGFSAGAVVATPSLVAIDIVDPVDDIPDGYDPAVPWEGLGFVDYSVVPHLAAPGPDGELIAQTIAELDARGMPLRALHDGEALVVVDGVTRLVGHPVDQRAL